MSVLDDSAQYHLRTLKTMPIPFPFGNTPYKTWKNAYDQLEIVTNTGEHFVEKPDTSLPAEGDYYYHFPKDELYRITWHNDTTLEYVEQTGDTLHKTELSHWEGLLNNNILFPVKDATTDSSPHSL